MHLLAKQEISKPEWDTGFQETNGGSMLFRFLCVIWFSLTRMEVGGENMILRCLLCQSGDRKHERLVLTLKVWWQVACPGIWRHLCSSRLWRLEKWGRGSELQRGFKRSPPELCFPPLHQEVLALCLTVPMAFVSKRNFFLGLFKFWWRRY